MHRRVGTMKFRVAVLEARRVAQGYIGRAPRSDDVFVATGFSGTGMTFGTIAALVFFDTVLGRESAWAEIYRATRVTPRASAIDYVRENVDFPMHFVGDRVRRTASPSPLAPPAEAAPTPASAHALTHEPRR